MSLSVGRPSQVPAVPATCGRKSCIHHHFADQAAHVPGRTALLFEGGSLSYGELERRADALAAVLRSQGAVRETLVGVCLSRRPELVVALLAVLKAGAAYVPIDPAYPKERIEYLLADSAAPLLITERGLVHGLPEGPGRTVIDVDDALLATPAAEVGISVGEAEDLAYVIYTSGSTGAPKGVAIEHRSAVALIRWAQATYTPGELAGVLFATSVCFDLSIFELFVTLGLGGTVILAENALELPAHPHRERITLVNTVPSVMSAVLDFGPLPESVRVVNLAGEALTAALSDRIYGALSGGKVYDLYGPSEDTTYSTFALRTPGGPATIGVPIEGTTAWILDPDGRTLGAGEAGELYLGGEGLARGYLHREDLTREKFIEHPQYGRLYRTGDSIRWNAGGQLEYIGRIDRQLKIRGYRVEPGEIEEVLCSHPDIAGCAVVPRRRDGVCDSLAAFVMVHRDGGQDWRGWLKERLPEYMVPASFEILEALPLTPNGKIDRGVLEAREPAGRHDESGDLPSTPTERRIAEIWQRLLRVSKVRVSESFLALGGHSLVAMRVAAELSLESGRHIPARLIFACGTIRELAAAVDRGDFAGQTLAAIPIADRVLPIPMSPGQQRFWLLDRTLPQPTAYNAPFAFHLHGPLDIGRVRSSLRDLMLRQEILRTVLVNEGENFHQRILPADELALPWTALTAASTEECAGLLRAGASHGFSLEHGPLWRALLVSVCRDEHWLLMVFHHAIIDEWSARLLFDEWQTLYAGTAELPALRVQYADFAAWQQQRLAAGGSAESVAFWRSQIEQPPPPLRLPGDRTASHAPDGAGDTLRFVVPAGVAARLGALAAAESVTLFSLVLAVFQAWLSRVADSPDFFIGLPVSQRHHPDLAGVAGFLLNTLPLRCRVDGAKTFREFARQTGTTCRQALDHDALPFERIVELAGASRGGGQSPLHQVMFVLLEDSPGEITFGEATGGAVPIDNGTAKCDLLLSVLTRGDLPGWQCELNYASGLFSSVAARAMAGQLLELMHSAAESPDLEVGKLSLVPRSDRERLRAWNHTEVTLPSADLQPHELFLRQAQAAPEAVAVVFGIQKLSYGELEARARRLAGHFSRLGVSPGDQVGICLERSPAWIVAVLATHMAGGACLPLDPAYPAERLGWMLEDSRPSAVVTSRSVCGVLPGGAVTLVCLDEVEDSSQPTTDTVVAGDADRLAYVLFTSGSTGRPKGVALSCGALGNLIGWQLENSEAGSGDRTLQFASLNFDVSFQEIFSTLGSGGTLVMVPDEVRRDLAALARVIREERVNRIFVPFVVLDDLAQLLSKGDTAGLALREVITAGEQLRITPALQELFGRLPEAILVNQYGPTETHVATSFVLRHPLPDRSPLPPIGRPVANTQVHILDRQQQELPIGVPGELAVGGSQLATGYLNQPEGTGRKFIHHPDLGRLYRTGDLARWNDSGELEFLGRIDRQLKVRGYRIEPGEIEAVLSAHPAVAACAVVPRRVGGEASSLVAFLVLKERAASGSEDWAVWLRRHLPEQMVPAAYVPLDALPLNPNGKVDRAVLEAMDSGNSSAYEAPRSPVERLLAEVWQEVLQVPEVGLHDDFFALGGHSILAMRVAARVSFRLERDMALRTLFDHPSIARLAAHLEGAGGLEPIPPADRSRPLPMSSGQQRFWALQHTLPDPAAYHVGFVATIPDALDGELLGECLAVLMRRHEVLRTALVRCEGELVQHVLAADEVGIPWQSFGVELDPVSAHELIGEETRRAFELDRAPLWRAMQVPVSGGGHLLLAAFHHAIIDEWSARIFFAEWRRLYLAGGDPLRAGLATPPLQFADFAAWQRQREEGNALDASREFWRGCLESPPPPLDLPADLPIPVSASGLGRTVTVSLPHAWIEGLRRIATDAGTTLFVVALAACQGWLHRLSGSTDFIVATPSSGRLHPDAEHVLGYCLNTLPLRARVDDAWSFTDFARQVREVVKTCLSHGELPFEQILETAGAGRSHGHQRMPLHQILFVLVEEEPAWGEGPAAPKVRLVDTGTAKCDLTLALAPGDDGWTAEINVPEDRFSAEATEALAASFATLIQAIVDDPDRPLGLLDVRPEGDRDLQQQWSGHAERQLQERCIHRLFERQVESAPDAIAIVSGSQEVSYSLLDRRANHIAAILQAAGPMEGALVGVCMKRDPAVIAVLLGILKAGAAYVPLDPDYPESRLAFMIEDARPAVVITDEAERHRFDHMKGLVVLGADELTGEAAEAVSPGSNLTPEHAAYVCYTSGSTGTPKGVVIPHRGVARLVTGQDYVALGPEETLLHAAPLAFDASTFEIWGALLNGGRLVLLPPGQASMDVIASTIADHGVTTAWLTAALFHLIVDERPEALRPLRQLLAGGDVLSPAAVRKTLEVLPCCRLINGYGPTENTTFTCCHTIGRDEAFPHGVPIGRPVANTTVHVLDASLRPVPVGVAGELFAGGDGLALGYLNQPELTAEKFPHHPDFGRLYRTGDLVRWSRRGHLEFLGRNDRQVKIRGFRIEPGEVEWALETHPSVVASAVIVHRRAEGDLALAAFVELRDRATAPDPRGWRQWLGERLPDHMVPASVTVLHELPMTPSGKIDRVALEKLDSTVDPAVEFDAPRTALETLLASVWEETLGIPRVGRNDDFFSLGGHSLTALRVASAVEKRLGRKLPVSSFLQAPTVKSQARLLEKGIAPPCIPLTSTPHSETNPPVFFIHGLGGDVFGLAQIARELSPDLPAYGIRAVNHGEVGNPSPGDLETLAAAYADEIVSVQPGGPYFIAGHSLGGWIAYEVARELKRRGRTVALLALFDTHPNCQVPWFPFLAATATHLADRLSTHWLQWRRLTRGARLDFLTRRMKAAAWWLGGNRRGGMDAAGTPPAMPQVTPLPVTQAAAAPDRYERLVRNHRPKRYRGSIDLFLASDALPRLALFWGLMTRDDLSVHRIPVAHEKMISSEGAGVLAARLRAVVLEAREEQAGFRLAKSAGRAASS